ncbi:endonuclease/exonuclease/phosphatase family metal-dependent hydrolase [Stackebrandtia endophytica]|uniref:Endonuclease/exonuclease/phosphatase family metal-dependent hydrolase n=1 Tax=Stackebrandtia endophytica TaxID=1496996 RepID=A0A543B2Q1_9ACTN|nr:endonuclease/exonuclease/phosphatase family protein [Stackebrandtia endophytica]TQL79123.1 endonuclease/exonuclease/phosphatase family metal-dependent hydrolase [Stackebrandtia endophytica]
MPSRFARLSQPVRWEATLVVVLLVTLEIVRSSGPTFDSVAGDHGVLIAAAVAVATFGAAVSVWPWVRFWGTGRGLAVGLVLLAITRLAIQEPVPRHVATVAVACVVALVTTMIATVACVRADATGPVRAVRGVFIAMAANAVLNVVWGTWDPVWRSSVIAIGYAVVLAVLLVFAAVALPHEESSRRLDSRAGAIGPVIAFGSVFLGAPAFVAAQTGLSTPLAAMLICLACGAAILSLTLSAPLVMPGVLLTAAVASTFLVPGVGAAVAIALAFIAMAHALVRAWRSATGSRWGGLGAGLISGLGLALIVLPYQAHYEMPLPIPQVWLPIAGAGLIAVAGFTASTVRRPTGLWRVPIVLVLVAMIPLALQVTRPGSASAPSDGDELRVLSWNIHYGVDGRATVSPEAIATVIENSGSHVVVLQEVSRGWPIAGGMDLVDWLPRRLGFDYVWSPAADRQFGNLILSALPMSDPDIGRLHRGEGSQTRSFAAVTVEFAGDEYRVMTTHLQHRDVTDTRLDQIDTIMDEWNGVVRTIIAGDLNAEPGWPEITEFTEAGFRSAQDEVGDPDRFTSPSVNPRHRVDWIFGTVDLVFTSFELLDTTVSDHLPLTATVRPA